jgi:regulator of protease activity HflC (stomatin/prohibitin superfamily)
MDGLASLLSSLSNLLAPLFAFAAWAWPVKIYAVRDGSRGIVLTMGKVRRKRAERMPGITICGPFEELIQTQTEGRYVDLPQQTLLTADGRVLVVNGALRYRVVDMIKAVLLTPVIDVQLEGIAMDHLRRWARDRSQKDVVESERATSTLERQVNRAAQVIGCEVLEV